MLFRSYTFAGSEVGESVSVDVPLRNYARGLATPSEAGDVCMLNLETGGCMFGAPFLSGGFMGLDDSDNSIWLAQGAVSSEGDGVQTGSLEIFGAGKSFNSL